MKDTPIYRSDKGAFFMINCGVGEVWRCGRVGWAAGPGNVR